MRMAQGREASKGRGTRRIDEARRDNTTTSPGENTAVAGPAAEAADEIVEEGTALGVALREAEGAPEDAAGWERLEQAAIAVARPAVALGAYRRALEADMPAAVGVALGRRAAAFQVEWLADRPSALEAILERVLRIDARCDWALRQLIVALTLGQRWDALLAVYDRALAAGPERERRVALLSEAAQVAKDFVGRQELAIVYLHELFALAPGDPQVSTVLERLLERHDRWTELVALWRARLGLVPPDEARALRERIALGELARLGDPGAALISLRALLGERGDPARALAALEEILVLESAPVEVRLGALDALESAYDGAGKPERALGVVETGLRFASGAPRQALLKNAARRRVAASDPRAAIVQLAALLPLEPDDREVEDWFRRLCREQSLPGALVDGLGAAAAATADGRRRASLRADIAAITDGELADPAAAIAAYQRAWREPDAGADAITQRRTLLRLDELLEAADRAAERLPVLAAHAELAARPSERRATLGTRARLATALGEVNAAVTAWRACLELDAADAEALVALPAVLAAAGRWAEYVEVLRHRIAVINDPRAQSADLARAALTERDQLVDRSAAIASFADHERRFGPSLEATDALADLFTEEKRWPELHALLAQTCRRDRARAATLAARLGDACRLRLDDSQHAVDWYESALIADPLHAAAREGLESLVALHAADEAGSVRRRAVAALLAASLETDDWRLRRGLMSARLADAADGRACATIFRETAEICEQRAHDQGTALAHVAAGLVADPDDRHLEAELLRLAAETADFAAAVRALEQAAGDPALPGRRAVELHALAGLVHEEKLDAAAAALADFTKALDAEPARQDLRLAVVRCAGRAARWDELAAALLSPHATGELRERTLFPVAETAARGHQAFVPLADALGAAAAAASAADHLAPATLLDLEGRIATWHERERNDLDAAEAALARALEHDPEHLPTLQRLAALQRRAPSPALYGTLRRMAALAPEDLDALGEATLLARELPLPDDVALDAARALLDRAARLPGTGLSAAPAGTRTTPQAVVLAVEEIAARLIAGGAREQLRATYDTYLRAAGLLVSAGADAELARAFRARAEELALSRLQDRPAAIRALGEMVDADPADDQSIERLAGLYAAEQRYAELAQLRRGQLGRSDSRERRLELRLELERVGGAIESASDRVTLLMANLDEAPGHVPTVDALTNVLGAGNRHAQLADTLGAQAETVENLGERAAAAALWSRLGRVAEEALGDRPRAIAAHERAAALITAAPTLDALGRLCMEIGQAEAAARWLDQLLGVAPLDGRPAVALRLGHAYLAIDRRHRAIACLERALAETPAAQAVRALLIDLHRRAGAAAPLAALLTESAALTDDVPTLLAIALEVNALATGPLGDPAQAVTALARAHEVAPHDQGVLLSLAVALLAAARPDEAGAALEAALPGARRSSERAQLLFHLGRVRRAQGRDGDAMTVLEQAAAIDLGNAAVLLDLFAAAGAAGDNERAERAGRALLALARGGDPQRPAFSVVEVLLRLRDLASARRDDAQAGELMESAMMAAVKETAEFRRLCARLRAEEQLPALASVLDKRIAAAASAVEEAEAYTEIAGLRAQLGQPDAALEAVLRALELRAEDPAVREIARALTARVGLADKALARVELLVDRRRRRGDGPLVARLLLWAGELCELQLGDGPRAIGYYRRAADTGEIPSAAAMALARAGALCDPDERARALERLERLAREEATPAGQAEALFGLAEAQLLDAATRPQGLASISAAVEKSGAMARALALLQQAKVSDGELAGVLPLYERTARQTGNDRQLLDALARRAATAGATSESIREGYDLATALHDDARAEELLAALVGLPAQDGGAADAVWGLVELGRRCRARGDLERAHENFARALEKTDPERMEPLLRELALEARGGAGQPALAARIYETLRARSPGNLALWSELFDLRAQLGDLESCDRLARERLDQLLDPAGRNEIRMRLIRLRLGADAADPAALEALRDVLLDDPSHDDGAELLAAHYEATGDLAALIDVRQGQIQAFEDRQEPLRVTALASGLARSLMAAGGGLAQVLAAYERALRARPGDRTLMLEVLALATALRTAEEMQQLDALLAAQPAPESFRGERAVHYRACAQWEALAALFTEQAAHEKDPVKSSALLREAATITHKQLGETAKAIELAQAARWAAGEDRRARTQSAQLMAQLLTDHQQQPAALQLLVEALAFAPAAEREQISATISHLRLLAAQPGPDPDAVTFDDLQEITDHG
jgi:tetratricopeptide (TPR) repeat protein